MDHFTESRSIPPNFYQTHPVAPHPPNFSDGTPPLNPTIILHNQSPLFQIHTTIFTLQINNLHIETPPVMYKNGLPKNFICIILKLGASGLHAMCLSCRTAPLIQWPECFTCNEDVGSSTLSRGSKYCYNSRLASYLINFLLTWLGKGCGAGNPLQNPNYLTTHLFL